MIFIITYSSFDPNKIFFFSFSQLSYVLLFESKNPIVLFLSHRLQIRTGCVNSEQAYHVPKEKTDSLGDNEHSFLLLLLIHLKSET